MSQLTLEFECLFNFELKEYLLSLDGIYEVEFEDKNFTINIKYNSNIIDVKILKLEILTFLKIQKMPSMISFDKHCKNEIKEHEIIIKDLCCEYCLKGMVDDLLIIDGIEKADCNIEKNYDKRENVTINISYDPKIITIKELEHIELELNK